MEESAEEGVLCRLREDAPFLFFFVYVIIGNPGRCRCGLNVPPTTLKLLLRHPV